MAGQQEDADRGTSSEAEAARQDCLAADWEGALERARRHSPFLAQALERQGALAQLLARGQGKEALAMAPQIAADAPGIDVALRRERLWLATTLAIGDLAGAFPLGEVMGSLSAFADRALDAALFAAIARRVEIERVEGLFALALGKHGALELNYSSDIDPILLYDPQALPRRSRDDPAEAAQRYAREAIRILADNTAEGYVFRVDMRLRPASEVSPLAISCEAALSHYESSALAWERAAFIRARAAAGDRAAGEAFLRSLDPFIWRSSLDFGAIADIRRLTQRVRAHYRGPRQVGPGYNVKHGRGGIRAIEFFAQTHQLIHGGRDPSLRLRSTRGALDALARAGHIAEEEAQMLGDAYDRLRTVEHRLQMIYDRQTHELPAGEALDGVARLDGLANGAALVAELDALAEGVARSFDRLLGEEGEGSGAVSLAARPDRLEGRLRELGLADPPALAARIARWRDGRYRALRSSAAIEAFDAMLPALIEALAEVDDPESALARWEGVLERASSAINLFRLIEARPALLEQLMAILSLAPALAEELGRRPELLDTLIDRSALELPGQLDALVTRMEGSMAPLDYERQLDRIRQVTGEIRFALGLQLITAAHDPLAIGAALSRTAEAALQVAVRASEAEFARKHGRIAGGQLLVLGLGRLGGGMLTHASDLDIVYLFSADTGAQSDGARPLGATLYFNRLAQRVSAALSVPTAQGALYEVDIRLRPQGEQGPLAVTIEGFARYQRESAWSWEHMALTRARVLVGAPPEREEVEAIIAQVLRAEREPVQLRADVLKMRDEMARHKRPAGPLDVKLLRGGLVDLEFLVHYLQLRDRLGFDPDLGKAIAALASAGLIDQGLVDAHDLLTRVLISGRLLAPAMERPAEAAAQALARACGQADYPALEAGIAAARSQVAQEWNRLMESRLEMDQ